MTKRERLSLPALLDGVKGLLGQLTELNKYRDYQDELTLAMGVGIKDKLLQGYKLITVIYPSFAPFFLSDEPEIVSARTALLGDESTWGKFEFYFIERTKEVIVLLTGPAELGDGEPAHS